MSAQSSRISLMSDGPRVYHLVSTSAHTSIQYIYATMIIRVATDSNAKLHYLCEMWPSYPTCKHESVKTKVAKTVPVSAARLVSGEARGSPVWPGRRAEARKDSVRSIPY